MCVKVVERGAAPVHLGLLRYHDYLITTLVLSCTHQTFSFTKADSASTEGIPGYQTTHQGFRGAWNSCGSIASYRQALHQYHWT